MSTLIEDYRGVFQQPIVLLTRHIAAGVHALRWRQRGTQRFVQLTDPAILPLIIDEQRRQQRTLRIGHFEAQRLRLNHDYAIAYHAERRARRLAKDLRLVRQAGIA